MFSIVVSLYKLVVVYLLKQRIQPFSSPCECIFWSFMWLHFFKNSSTFTNTWILEILHVMSLLQLSLLLLLMLLLLLLLSLLVASCGWLLCFLSHDGRVTFKLNMLWKNKDWLFLFVAELSIFETLLAHERTQMT